MSLDKKDQLQQVYALLEQQVEELPLATKPTDIVPGEGNPDADIMFIGEAPGYHESVQRRPFVGRSGQFFRKTLQQEAKIDEKEVYISNIVKVRPPENRDPTVAEIKAYKFCLDQEIAVINPLVIATLGRFSMAKFLNDVRISQVHGRLHTVRWNDQRLFILPMFHPAAALRNPRFREAFVADFQKLPKILAWVKEKKHNFKLEENVKEILLS